MEVVHLDAAQLSVVYTASVAPLVLVQLYKLIKVR